MVKEKKKKQRSFVINVGISLILIGIYNIHFFKKKKFLFCGGGVGGAGVLFACI